MENKNLEGVYNLTSPHPVTNLEFTAALGKSLHRPTFFSISAFVIKLIFREMGETLLLKGSRVISKRLAEAGYRFKFSKIKDALENIVR